MFRNLKPDQTEKTIYAINLCNLSSKGYKNLIIDLDNTMVAWNQNDIPYRLHNWIKNAKSHGFKICLLSNSKIKRIQCFASQLGILACSKGGKPFKFAFKHAIKILHGNSRDTVVIGDQIFTDIWGGNRMRLYTILVDPVSKKEFIGTKFSRLMERLIVGRR